MNKHNYFVTFLKKLNLSINSLLQKYLNRLNRINLSYIVKSNKVLLVFVSLFILFFTYISIPHVYNRGDIQKELESQFLGKYGLNLITKTNYKYKFFPRPHFILENSYVEENKTKISNIKKLKIFVSLNNLFSLKKMKIYEVELYNANFYFDIKNYNFFIKLLNKNFSKSTFKIKDSNVFYRNLENEVLFINKIKNLKFYFDPHDLQNILTSENEVFNVPYSFKMYIDKEKKIYSKINLNFLKLQIESELDHYGKIKKGTTNFTYNQKKSTANYKISKNLFDLKFFDKLNDSSFNYEVVANFKPFFAKINGKTDQVDLSYLFKTNSAFVQMIKTQIFNHKNLNINMDINANKINKYKNFKNIILNSKIKEGLIDIDNTKFSWKDDIIFKLSNTLIYSQDNKLILDGKLIIEIIDTNEIYKYMLTPKNNRYKINQIELNINYIFDDKIMNLNNIMINNQKQKKVDVILKNLIFKGDNIQDKIYMKNIFNKALKAYEG